MKLETVIDAIMLLKAFEDVDVYGDGGARRMGSLKARAFGVANDMRYELWKARIDVEIERPKRDEEPPDQRNRDFTTRSMEPF